MNYYILLVLYIQLQLIVCQPYFNGYSYSFHPNTNCAGAAIWAAVYQERISNESCRYQDSYYKWAQNDQFIASPTAYKFPTTIASFIAFYRYADTSCTVLDNRAIDYFQEGRCVHFATASQRATVSGSSVLYEIFDYSSTCSGTPTTSKTYKIGSCDGGYWTLYSGNIATTESTTAIAVGVTVPLALLCLCCLCTGIFLLIFALTLRYVKQKRQKQQNLQHTTIIMDPIPASSEHVSKSSVVKPNVPPMQSQLAFAVNPYHPLSEKNPKGEYPMVSNHTNRPLPSPPTSAQALSLTQPVLLHAPPQKQHSYTTDYTVDYQLLDFKESKILGGGGQGIVVTAKYYNTPVAVKFFSKKVLAGTDDSSLQEFYNEAKFLAQYSNFINIIRFIGVAEDLKENKVCLVTELLPGGNLAQWIESATLSLNDKVALLFGIANGMQYLHSHNIIHRDLKCENVLLDETHKIPKIMDFGFSKQMETLNKSMNMTYNVGTAAYIAPEVIATEMIIAENTIPNLDNGSTEYSNSSTTSSSLSFPQQNANLEMKKQYDKMADVYSFGMIMYVLYTENRNPYGKVSAIQIMNQLAKNPHFRPAVPEPIPEEHEWYIELMRRCWKTNPKKRPDFEEISFILDKHLQK